MSRSIGYSLPKLLKEDMENLGWDVRTLAKKAGVKEPMLYANLRGDNPMSLPTALKVLKALGYKILDPALILLSQINKRYEKAS